MAQTAALDVSRWQGDIDWKNVQEEIAIIKMTGGDDGLYVDSKANANYYGAKAAGKAIGMYHFAGGKDPVNEADFFIAACSPLEQDDVMILDWELNGHPDPVGWCKTFIQRVIDRTHTIPLIYMSASRTVADRDGNNAIRYTDWSPVVNQNVGLWVAHYGLPPEADVPVKYWPTYAMHQHTSEAKVPGVSGNVDRNIWFGSVVQFKKYGFKSNDNPVPVPPPVVAPVPVDPTPTPQPEPPAPDPVHPTPTPTPNPEPPVPTPTPPVVVEPPVVVVNPNPKAAILTAITAIAAAIAAIMAYLRT